MPENSLAKKSREFAKQIILLCRSTLANQLLRSGTSIGANIHEAQYAQEKKGFCFEI